MNAFVVLMIVSVACSSLAAEELIEGRTLEQLIQMLSSKSAGEKFGAATILRRAGTKAKPAIVPLTTLLTDKSRWVRVSSLLAIEAIGPEAKEVVDPLVAHLQKADQKDSTETAAVCRILAALGPEAKDALAAIENLLASEDEGLRFEAAFTHWRISGNADPAAKVLAEGVKDRDRGVCVMALEKLGKMGPAAREAVPDIEKHLKSRSKSVRKAAKEAIEKISVDADPQKLPTDER
jgi:HEAT repeat protein